MKRPLMGMGIALVAGVAAGHVEIKPLWIFLGLVVSVILVMLWTDSSYKYVVGLSVFFIVGFCRAQFGNPGTYDLDGEIQGEIYRIQEKEKCTYLYMNVEDDLAVLVIVMKADEMTGDYYKGQVYHVTGEAEKFSLPGNPGQFDELTYYHSQGIGYRIWADQISLISDGDWLHQHLRWLEHLKNDMSTFYAESMNADGAGVLSAAVLGDRSGFQEDLRAYYQENGWMHLVTTSGLHLSFIAMGLYKRMRRLTVPPEMATIVALFVMMGYGYMTDFGDSMLRAMGMMVLSLVGRLLGRRTDALTSLVFLAAVMLLFQPKRLVSSGFLLTYGAVGGMIFGKWLKKAVGRGKKKAKKSGFSESLCIQIGIFVITLPILLWFMYEIPFFGFVYNFMMIPLISILTPVGFAAGCIGCLNVPILKLGAGWVLKIIDGILHLVHQLPSQTLICGRPEEWQILLFVLCLILGSFLIYMKRKRFGMMVMVLSCLFLLFVRVRTDQMIFMDVGQGDGICILTKTGQAILIDGGSSDVKELYTYRIEPLLKYYGIDQIDAWFLTHGDGDHVSGIEEALSKNVPINQIILPDVVGDEILNAVQESARRQGILAERIVPGQEMFAGDYTMTCLYPKQEWCIGDQNNDSLVLWVDWQGGDEEITTLLTGDIEEKGEEILMQQAALESVDILKVAHHGSSGSTTDRFLNVIHPKWAIISCGESNSYGHPHKETLERFVSCGCRWLTTPRQGAIHVEFEKDGYAIYGYQKKD